MLMTIQLELNHSDLVCGIKQEIFIIEIIERNLLTLQAVPSQMHPEP